MYPWDAVSSPSSAQSSPFFFFTALNYLKGAHECGGQRKTWGIGYLLHRVGARLTLGCQTW